MLVWAACIQCSPLNRNKVGHLLHHPLLLHLLQILQLHPQNPQKSQNPRTGRFPLTVQIPLSPPPQVEYQRPLHTKRTRENHKVYCRQRSGLQYVKEALPRPKSFTQIQSVQLNPDFSRGLRGCSPWTATGLPLSGENALTLSRAKMILTVIETFSNLFWPTPFINAWL